MSSAIADSRPYGRILIAMVESLRLKSFGPFENIYIYIYIYMPTLDHPHEAWTNFWRGHNKAHGLLEWRVEGAIITQKIRGDVTGLDPLIPTTAAFHVHTKSTRQPPVKPKGRQEPFCEFCENRSHWAQDCKDVTDVKDRTEKLKLAFHVFLCLNRGHSLKNCSKKGKVLCSKCRKSHHQTSLYPLPWIK